MGTFVLEDATAQQATWHDRISLSAAIEFVQCLCHIFPMTMHSASTKTGTNIFYYYVAVIYFHEIQSNKL